MIICHIKLLLALDGVPLNAHSLGHYLFMLTYFLSIMIKYG